MARTLRRVLAAPVERLRSRPSPTDPAPTSPLLAVAVAAPHPAVGPPPGDGESPAAFV